MPPAGAARAAMPGFRRGKAPRNKGQRYPADPPSVDEIVAIMREAQKARYGHRLNGLIVVLWRAGLRINEALSLTETDLDDRTARRWRRACAGAWRRTSSGMPTPWSCCTTVSRCRVFVFVAEPRRCC